MKWDIIIQNNASKQVYVYQGHTPNITTPLYISFEDFDLDVPNGEYNYYLLPSREGRQYETAEVPLNSIVIEGEVRRTLDWYKPYSGLLRVGEVEMANKYNKRENKTFYYK